MIKKLPKLNKDGSVRKKGGPKKGLEGRRVELTDKDFEMVKGMAQAYCTKQEIADILGMSLDTLRLRLKERGIVFKAFFEQKRGMAKAKVRKAMLDKALEGDTGIMIWWSKNHLGMSDKNELDVNTTAAPKIEINFIGKDEK